MLELEGRESRERTPELVRKVMMMIVLMLSVTIILMMITILLESEDDDIGDDNNIAHCGYNEDDVQNVEMIIILSVVSSKLK